MRLESINADTVRNALRAVRGAQSLADSPLAALDALTVRLHDEGLADTRASRGWLLSRMLDELIWREVRQLDGRRIETDRAGLTAERERDIMARALASEIVERQAWAVLYLRYMALANVPLGEAAQRLDFAERTAFRRLEHGHRLLVGVLRECELDASRRLDGALGGAPVSPIVLDGAAAEREPVQLVGELRDALDAGRSIRLSPAQLGTLARRPATDLVSYRLGRIAEWTQPRYRLDKRFIEMSLLVDVGEESASGRWQVREQRFSDLSNVLAGVSEPAVVLLGPPGSGKSTLLRRLELDLCLAAMNVGARRDATPLTILVSLNQYRPEAAGEPLPEPGAWLATRWARRYPKLPPLPAMLADGPVLFLLDGLNEMPHRGSEEYRARIVQWKRFLHETVAVDTGHRAVLACRSLDYGAPLSSPSLRVPHIRLEPLNDEQVHAFVRSHRPQDAERVWAELCGTKMLDAVRWPYLLRLLCDEPAEDGPLSGGRAALFTSLVRRSLEREVQRDNPLLTPGPLLDLREYRRIVSGRPWPGPYDLPHRGRLIPKLAALACQMQRANFMGEAAQVRVRYDEAVAMLDDDQADTLLEAGSALGLLEDDRVGEDVLFRHQLLQEYFAGRALAVEPEPRLVERPWRAQRMVPRIEPLMVSLAPYEPLPPLEQTGWEESTLLAATMAADPVAFLRGLMAANLALAGRTAAQPELRACLPQALLDELRWALVGRSRDPACDLRVRMDCARAVGDLGDPRFELRCGPQGDYLLPPLIAIAGGSYAIGDDEPILWSAHGLSTLNGANIPRHEIEIGGFQVGQYLVTNAEFACFVRAGGYEDERWWRTEDARRCRQGLLPNEGALFNNRVWRRRLLKDAGLLERAIREGRMHDAETEARWRAWVALDDEAFEAALEAHWRPKGEVLEGPEDWRDDRCNHPSQPVVGVSWYEARAYCAWLGAQSGLSVRLPTEAQWEVVAGGSEGRRFPWGDGEERMRANTDGAHVMGTSPVGVFVEGDTPDGVADLGGNAWEWTRNLFGETDGDDPDKTPFSYPYDASDGREDVHAPASMRRVVRGGGWSFSQASARSAFRDHSWPAIRSNEGGMRIVVLED